MFSRIRRPALQVGKALALTAALGGAVALPASASPAFYTFGYTGGVQDWIVPDGITSARIDLYGAAGGEPYVATFNPGKGGRALTDYVELTPGRSVRIVVGGKGGYPGGGYNGGGDGRRFGGGGATDIRIGGHGLADRLIVAGGGGGTGDHSGVVGGAGGGLTGGSGSGAFGGGGGTQTAAGVGTYPSWGGFLGSGGPGANSGPNVTGGGGGGWYGGAGGPGGGGGGSGHGTDRTHFTSGVEASNGRATITVGPPTGLYSGRDVHGSSIAFRLSSDYATVTSFQWFDRQERFASTTFHQAGTGGSFSQWTARDMHFWGHWDGSSVTGGISYPDRGERKVRHWTARRDYTG